MIGRDYFKTAHGRAILGDSLEVLRAIDDACVDLVITSPPFDLTREKEYGNRRGDDYLRWLGEYGTEVRRILKDTGSFVMDLGGAWTRGLPTRNLYQFRALLHMVDVVGFHLAQDFYWWNPSRLPTPAEWVTIRRIRVKDAVNTIWWMSKTPYPKASNRRVLQGYSRSMKDLLENGYTARARPSGHNISTEFGRDNGGAIPPNLIAVANTDSGSSYMRYCSTHGIAPHPARFPQQVPEFFIRLLTDEGDLVVDPFAGSCATGAVAEELSRTWLCVELEERYLRGAIGRFERADTSQERTTPGTKATYTMTRLGTYPDSAEAAMNVALPLDGGRKRAKKAK